MKEDVPDAKVDRLEYEAQKLAELIARMGAAALGHLKPTDDYPARPCVPVQEILVLRRTAVILAKKLAERKLSGFHGLEISVDDIQEEFSAAWLEAERETPIPYKKEVPGG